MSFQHEREIPQLVPIKNCISEKCGRDLTKWELKRRLVFCVKCEKEALIEHAGILITKYGIPKLKKIQNNLRTHEKLLRNQSKRINSQNTVPGGVQKNKGSNSISENNAQGDRLHKNNRPVSVSTVS